MSISNKNHSTVAVSFFSKDLLLETQNGSITALRLPQQAKN
jgi:hypothetical protein